MPYTTPAKQALSSWSSSPSRRSAGHLQRHVFEPRHGEPRNAEAGEGYGQLFAVGGYVDDSAHGEAHVRRPQSDRHPATVGEVPELLRRGCAVDLNGDDGPAWSSDADAFAEPVSGIPPVLVDAGRVDRVEAGSTERKRFGLAPDPVDAGVWRRTNRRTWDTDGSRPTTVLSVP